MDGGVSARFEPKAMVARSAHEAARIVTQGEGHRNAGSIALNLQSSHSHSIVTVVVKAHNKRFYPALPLNPKTVFDCT